MRFSAGPRCLSLNLWPRRRCCPWWSGGIRALAQTRGVEVHWETGVPEHVARSCAGDVRKALNAVEALFAAHAQDPGEVVLTLAETQMVAQRSANRYDRDGDSHYDLLSAFQKSIRGSDPDAAVHYLALLLEAGDLISPCRRLMVIASEDVGLAHPQAVAVVKACVDSANMLGLPEARIPWPRRPFSWLRRPSPTALSWP